MLRLKAFLIKKFFNITIRELRYRNTCACAVSLCEALTMLLSSLTSKNNTEKSELLYMKLRLA